MGKGKCSIDQFLNYVVAEMVNKPDEVKINIVEGEKYVLIELRVADEDVGKVIGRNGLQANSLRNILMAVGGQRGKIYKLEVQDNSRKKKQ